MMTVIVGIQGNGWAVLAADSMTTYTERPYVAKGYDKIVKVGEYLIAVAGDAIAGDILNNLWQPPKVIKTQDPDRFMMIRVLPSIKQTLADAGYEPAPKTKSDDDTGWDALVCFNGKLYQVTDDFGYMRDDKNLYGIGSGGGLALGALASMELETKTHAKASSAAKKAVNIAIQYNIWCGGPVHIKTQFTK
jgi:ATP-dependent protease HslVU (ClpYQ) peptidase subunit